jgi:hypothetical protein
VDIETVSVISSGVVALAAIANAGYQQNRGRAHDRELSDLEAVRSALAEAAAVLHRSEYALDDALSTLRAWGAAFFEDEERAKPYFRLEEIGREADLLKGRLRILFGPTHPVALRFDDANTAMLDAFRALGMIKVEPPAERGTPEREEIRGWAKEQRERMETAHKNFGIAQGQFIEAAHVAAGARLPEDDD